MTWAGNCSVNKIFALKKTEFKRKSALKEKGNKIDNRLKTKEF